MGVSGQHHAPAALYPRGKDPRTHCTGGWVCPRAGLDTEDRGKILCPCRGSNPNRPVVQPVVRHYTACTAQKSNWVTYKVTVYTGQCMYMESFKLFSQMFFKILGLINEFYVQKLWKSFDFSVYQLYLNLNSVNQLIFVMVKCGVLFEVRTEFLNNI
jgi:hypothetical protein